MTETVVAVVVLVLAVPVTLLVAAKIVGYGFASGWSKFFNRRDG